MTIFLSVGHNNARNIRNILIRDKGAISGVYNEYNICRAVAEGVRFRYRMLGGTHTIVTIPEGLSLVDRIAFINKRAIDGDICVELHMNAGGGQGAETYYYTGSEYAKKKALKMNKNLCRVLNIRNRGAKGDTTTRFGRLGFVRDTKPLALLLELGFIDSLNDRGVVQMFGSQAVAEGLFNTFG